MVKRVKSAKSAITRHRSPVLPSDRLREILGPLPLFEGESEENHNELHEQIRLAVSPKDALEEIWVRDVVDLVWEGLRLRRLKANLAAAIRAHAIYYRIFSVQEDECMREFGDDEDYDSTSIRDEARERALALHIAWKQGDPEALEAVSYYLHAAGDSENVMMAEALQEKFEVFERIDRLILQTEVRRHAALREIDRHRDALARRLREAIRNVDDADFEDIVADDRVAAQ